MQTGAEEGALPPLSMAIDAAVAKDEIGGLDTELTALLARPGAATAILAALAWARRQGLTLEQLETRL
jgi:hypothetical protein